MTIHSTIQEFLKQNFGSCIKFKGRWLRYHFEGPVDEWVVRHECVDLEGTRRIETLVRTPDEAEALHVLMHGKAEELGD